MLNELDDLFRQQLGPHATPPGEDLQRRLAALAEAERLDARFRTGLGSHASQPRRELWERLEDEHLRPQPQRRRRMVAWWQRTAAAVLLLALLAGSLWRGGYLRPAGGLASRPAGPPLRSLRTGPAPAGASGARRSQTSGRVLTQVPAAQAIAHAPTSLAQRNSENFSERATGRAASSSSPSIAATTRPRRAASALRAAAGAPQQHQQPDAAAGQPATTGQRHSPVGPPAATLAEAPASRPAPRESRAVVAAVMTSPPEVVEVEVRRGAEPSRPAPAPVIAAELPPARRPRLRLGGLLRQANHLVHGEPVSLAEATGLAENVTVQARFGGCTLSKTIQL